MKNKLKHILLQIIRFWIAGGVCVAIDFLLLRFFKEICGLDVLIASGISYTVSVVVNYLISVFFVFDGKRKMNMGLQFVVFLILSLIGLGLNEVIMYIGTDVMEYYYMLVKVVEICIVAIWNFLTRKMLLDRMSFSE